MVSELRLSYPHWLLVMNCLGFYVVGSNWRLTLFKEKLMICTIINLTGMYKSQSGISIQKKSTLESGSDLQCIQAIYFLAVCVFPGNRTHNLCAANAML